MDCQQIDKYVFEYSDNRLSSNIRALIDEHLNECSACRRKIDFASSEYDLLKESLALPELGSDFTRRVMDSIKAVEPNPVLTESPTKARINSWYYRNRLWLGTAAVALLIMAVSFQPVFNLLLNKDKSMPDEISLSGQKSTVKLYSMENEALPDTVADNEKSKTEPLRKFGAHEGENSANMLKIGSVQKQALPDNQNLDLPRCNLPDDFTLSAETIVAEDSVTYFYHNAVKDQELQLSILRLPDEDSQVSFMAQTHDGANLEQSSEYGETRGSANPDIQNIYEKVINYDGRNYRLKFKGNLPVEELSSIAATVQFRENTSNEPD